MWSLFCRHRTHHPKPPVPTPTPPPSSLTVAWTCSDPSVDSATLATWVAALNAQVPDIQALWPHVQECNHVVRDPRAGEVVAKLQSQTDYPGALAYHTVKNGVPSIVVGVQTCRDAGVSVSSAMSHEACELTVDPSCTLTATAPNGDVWDLEVSDPVQASSYMVTTPGGPVEVSDLVGQAFFGIGFSSLDKTANVGRPFTVAPGGYAVINGQQVLGRGARSWGDPDDEPRSTRRPT